MATKLGMDCKLFYNAAGNENPIVPGNWTENDNIGDLDLSVERDQADSTTRANAGWKTTEPALADGEVTFTMVEDPDDAHFAVFQAAFFNKTALGVAVMTGSLSTSGERGLVATMKVTTFSRGENLNDVVKYNVTLKPSRDAANAPRWYTVPA